MKLQKYSQTVKGGANHENSSHFRHAWAKPPDPVPPASVQEDLTLLAPSDSFTIFAKCFSLTQNDVEKECFNGVTAFCSSCRQELATNILQRGVMEAYDYDELD